MAQGSPNPVHRPEHRLRNPRAGVGHRPRGCGGRDRRGRHGPRLPRWCQVRTITVCAHRYGLREVRVKPGMWTLEDMARLVGYGIVMVTDGRGRLRDYCHVVAIRRGRVIDTQDLTRVARVATLV